MNRKWRILLALWMMFAVAGCSAQGGVYTLKIVDRGSLQVMDGEVLQADIVLLDGEFAIDDGGHLQGSLYQVLGTSSIEGRVTGQISQWGGKMRIGPGAAIKGTLALGGGEHNRSPRAVITGGVTEAESQLSLGDWVRATTRDQILWSVAQIFLTVFLAVGVAIFFPRHLAHVREAEGSHWMVSLSMGLLVGLVGLVLIVQMVFTILLIPIAFLGGLVFLLAVLLGLIGCGDLIGRWILRRLGWDGSPAVTAGSGTLIFMTGLQILQNLPGPGGLLAIIAAVLGLGAVFLTRFGFQRFIPASIRQ